MEGLDFGEFFGDFAATYVTKDLPHVGYLKEWVDEHPWTDNNQGIAGFCAENNQGDKCTVEKARVLCLRLQHRLCGSIPIEILTRHLPRHLSRHLSRRLATLECAPA